MTRSENRGIPLFNAAYLRSVWAADFETFNASSEAEALHARLKNWAEKDRQTETAAEAAFIELFFKQTWGYCASGEGDKSRGFTLWQQFPVKGAGMTGGTGKADVALGHFGRDDEAPIPQVLGEFKDDRSGLDKPQSGRPNARSPVEQCLDYLRESRTGLISPILPTWGLVTDMNEIRLYRFGSKAQYQRFVIRPADGDLAMPLTSDDENAAFERFLLHRIFHAGWLLSEGGKSPLEKLLDDQLIHEQALENEFYVEYREFRETLYRTLSQYNPHFEHQGRLRRLVRLTQRILDRCLFILYCEDMGAALSFPPNILRDLLIEVSGSRYYNPEADDAWHLVKRLFAAMRDGSPFGDRRINPFNGGLFAEDPEMDALKLPNQLFCEKNQGQSPDRILQFPKTLLFLSAKYNFGASDDGGGRSLSLTAMGRIFEQSITDLEVMEAQAEGRESLTELTRRKRDGVYYTPEWVTHYIVEETIGARLSEIRETLGFDRFGAVTDDQIHAWRGDRRKAKVVGEYLNALRDYEARMKTIKVVDPACGSGAFLIQAFKYLYEQRQWIAREMERVTGEKGVFDTHEAMSAVLSQNLYGADINAESVEITRLALWLHTALPNRPLTYLDRNIQCGNSLIGHDFYPQLGLNPDLLGADARDRVRTFDWAEAFPEVFDQENPGFDCVIGNPPYVKLQHFRKVQADVARYLVEAKREDGQPLYESTQTGNFDLYLPFIERGVELLNTDGKMGYIAPSVWTVNEYGKGLRRKLKQTRRLDRWVDFKSYQVFDEAITYTALQFFTGTERDQVRCAFAPKGKEDITAMDWRKVDDGVRFENLPEADSWVFLPKAERCLHKKLLESCKRLDQVCKGITVGIQTSADYIYHLERIGPDRYFHKPKGGKALVEVEIEDGIMHPLVSGPEAKRYQVPDTSTYLLFPYEVTDGAAHLFTAKEMEARYPKAWEYLKSYESSLRSRESGKFDDDQWYRFGRHQNIDKQELEKLCVAQLVPAMRVCYDSEGEFYFNNVRVNGIIPVDIGTGWFLLGILNAPLCDYIFKRIAKPKAGGYYEANKQFIAPLPIPEATESEKAQVVELAMTLQELHTMRRDLTLMIDKRLESAQCEDDKRDAGWLWADVKPIKAIKADAPAGLKGRELTAWAKARRESLLDFHLDAINTMLRPGVKLTVENEYGELKLLANRVPVIDGVFLDENESGFIEAQWRQKARRIHVTEKFDAKRLINLLLKLRKTDNPSIRHQIHRIDADLRRLDAEIDRAETEMNRLTYRLYNLTDDEIRLVERVA
jgi:hypothetical protein